MKAPQNYSLQEIKDALLLQYAKDVCDIGKQQIAECNNLAELIQVYKYYQETLLDELNINPDFFRIYLANNTKELREQWIYIDENFHAVNAYNKTIVLIGNCKLRLISDKTQYTKVIALDTSKVELIQMEYAITDVFIAEESSVKINYINEYAKVTIKSQKGLVTYPKIAK